MNLQQLAFPLYRSVLPLALVATLISGCSHGALQEAQALRQSGQHEAALERLEAGSRQAPDDVALKNAYIKQRDTAIAHLLYQAESARAAGQMPQAESLLQRIEALAPGNPRAAWLRADAQRQTRQQQLMQEAREAMGNRSWARAEAALRAILAEAPHQPDARALLGTLDEQRAEQTRRQSSLQLATAGKPITLEFREAALRTVFESLARAAELNFVFDKDVRGEAKVTLFLRNTTVDEALRVILNTQQLGAKLLNANTVLVFPNTSQKQRDLLDTVTRSFYLVNADPKQAQSLVRTMAKTRDIFVDERLNLLVVRDTPEVVRLVERLIASIDLPDPEVMLELDVMEVSSKKLNELGLKWPDAFSYGLPGGGDTLSSTAGLRWSVANPVAVATLKGSTDATNLLANPKIRARNREKAKILLGEKLPVFTTTSTANVGVSASVSYLDVGLKLDLEPQVQLDNEVTIKVALEVSSVTGRVIGPQDSLAYQVGTRQATTSLRLKDGETQILAGLINDEEGRNAAGLPWLHDLPVLSRLFGTTRNTHNKTEVVLLITPRVVRNLNQNLLPVSPMASGTEAQPGAAPWMMDQGQVGNVAGAGRLTTGREQVTGRPAADEAAGEPVSLTGPEEAMPGASFQITVANHQAQALRTTLIYDASLLEASAEPGGSGQWPLEVQPQGVQVVTLKVKAGAPPAEALVSLATGTATWRVKVKAPGPGADGGAPPEPDDEPAR
ncbi:MAG: general secretion pathway protein GspD [Rubrivivax sp.]|nr:MAG: general secretion pathway protein GspD [Rubrivivax sp.]